MTTGVVFVGHGTRDPEGIAEFQALTDKVRNSLPETVRIVRYAFLEFVEPAVPETLAQCVADGVTQLLLVPVFLFSARHLKNDLPEMMKAIRHAHPEVEVRMTSAIGNDEPVIQVAALRLVESGYPTGSQIPVILVGRGNYDSAAQVDFERVADVLRETFRGAPLHTGYLAGSGRPLEHVLQELLNDGVQQVWLLPYLLFTGYLTRKLNQRVRLALDGSALQTQIASHIGAHGNLADTLTRRVLEQLASFG